MKLTLFPAPFPPARVWTLLIALGLNLAPADAADFEVRTPNDQFALQINGTDSPTLTLVRGRTYTFDVQTTAGFHPFHIDSPGVDVNDIASGTITYTVPTSAGNYFYNCSVHGDSMRGEIITVEPPVTADFVVRTPGDQFAFQINGTDGPTLTLVRGRTYTFDVQTSAGFHPFHIESPGVDVNDIASGTIRYTVPTNVGNYYYNCTVHGDSMRGEIVTVAPPVPPDFVVRTPADQFAFQINGTDSPTLTLVRGRTYTFDVVTTPGFHPFHIESPGVDVNDITSGRITYTVPTSATNYYYNCAVHGDSMRGEIVTIAPPAPPTFTILSVAVGSNIVLTSTGTNNWTVNPEFNTNLMTTNWFALTVQINRFANGTNEVICGRPPGNNVFIRLRAQQVAP